MVYAKDDPEDLKLAVILLRSLRSPNKTQFSAKSKVSRTTLSLAERGTTPTRRTLERVARAVGFPVEFLDSLLVLLRPVRLAAEQGSPTAQQLERLVREAQGAAEGWLGIVRSAALLLLSASAHSEVSQEDAHRKAQEAWQRIALLPVEQQRLLVPLIQGLLTREVVEVVCEESVRTAADDAGRALELAELALLIADQLPERRRTAIQGYAWGFIANARRVGGKLRQANEAFEISDQLWQAGGSDSGALDGSRLLDLKASLRKDQRRPAEALELLDRAARMPGLAPGRKARLLLKKAEALRVCSDWERALAHLREAEPAARSGENPRLLCSIRFEQAANLCELGRAAEAEGLLPEIRILTGQTGNRLDPHRALWLEGRVVAGLGRTGEAIELLSRARSEFADLGMDYDAAMLMVELAALYLEIGRTAEVKALTRLSAPVFVSEDVPEEARKALALFRRAVERETLTLELARRLAVYLHRAQGDPGLRFEAPASPG